jgi:hypothetical protein
MTDLNRLLKLYEKQLPAGADADCEGETANDNHDDQNDQTPESTQ